jgi:hypothetical protein
MKDTLKNVKNSQRLLYYLFILHHAPLILDPLYCVQRRFRLLPPTVQHVAQVPEEI